MNHDAQNMCCSDGVSLAFLLAMQCSLVFSGIVVFRIHVPLFIVPIFFNSFIDHSTCYIQQDK